MMSTRAARIFLAMVFGFVVATCVAAATSTYVCPMHPGIRSDRPGLCQTCGMTLVDTTSVIPGRHGLGVKWAAGAPRAGESARLRLSVERPGTHERVAEFEDVHERPFHLFVVSWDLEHFAHVHPVLQPDGAMEVSTVLPQPGAYQLYADFLPARGVPQLLQQSVFTEGVSPASAAPARAHANTIEGEVREGVDRGLRIRIEPARLVAGRVEVVGATFEDAATGEPVEDLEPYLGAWGHALIVSADLADAVHSHPVTPLTSPGGPRIFFSQRFPRPGYYRMWLQVQRRGEIATVPFTLHVERS
jgi:hypothetical protein